MSACYAQSDCFVGYHGRVLTREVVCRSGPGDEFSKIRTLRAGLRFAVTSTRNPGAISSPPMMPAVNGWRWGYAFGMASPGKPVKQTGCWVPDDALGPDTYTSAWAVGPARLDFHVGRSKPRAKKRGSNGKAVPVREYVIRSQKAYLRLAPHSTSIGYLHNGDRVRSRRRWGFYTCVEVLSSRGGATARSGWVLTLALRRAT